MQPGTSTPVDALVEHVLAHPDLWPRLVALDDQQQFVESLVDLAARWDLELSADDVRAALVSRRREWFERWI